MQDKKGRDWILEKGIPIVRLYGDQLTIRALHYQLVSEGMPNDIQHYKKVVDAMGFARWEGLLPFDAFSDHERETLGKTRYDVTDVDSQVNTAKFQIKAWARSYSKNRWENQLVYPEVFIEKKALQGVFDKTCQDWDVALNPCKGYPSITFLNQAADRFIEARNQDKEPVILYFGDYDCSGEDIPRSIVESLSKLGVDVELKRILLLDYQVKKWKLPPAPTKSTDSRAANWDGAGQVELDAVKPPVIIEHLTKALEDLFDRDAYEELLEKEAEEKAQFKKILKRDFKSLLDE